jgi:DNA replicative helicase MCM subunit Mcm2 (Cdc46/Mcm family)
LCVCHLWTSFADHEEIYFTHAMVFKSIVDLFCLQIIASHIIKVHSSASATRGENRTPVSKEENWLKRYAISKKLIRLFINFNYSRMSFELLCKYRYLQYCRTECHPRLSEAAARLLQNNYVQIRQVFMNMLSN